jgi:hypothetical protein
MLRQKQKDQSNGWHVLQRIGGHAVFARRSAVAVLLVLVLCAGVHGIAMATTTSTSTHYSVTETQFGGGSQTQQCSTTYCAKSSAGDTAVGRSGSTNYSAEFGSNTTDIPLLQVITANGNHALGTLDQDTTGVATSTLNVRHYLMAGYAVELTGSSPSQGTHAILPLNVPAQSQSGHEQFGVNLVANNTPNIGQNPTMVPSGDSAISFIASGYNTPDYFKYIPGDILAENTTQSGEIDYTLSMIFNVSAVTPGGQYKGAYSAVVVPMY